MVGLRTITMTERAAAIAADARKAGITEGVLFSALAALVHKNSPKLAILALASIEAAISRKEFENAQAKVDAAASPVLSQFPVTAKSAADAVVIADVKTALTEFVADSAEADFIARRAERLQ